MFKPKKLKITRTTKWRRDGGLARCTECSWTVKGASRERARIHAAVSVHVVEYVLQDVTTYDPRGETDDA